MFGKLSRQLINNYLDILIKLSLEENAEIIKPKVSDCFNREHLWPKSWFGGFDYGQNAQTDLFELWPSDGYVNGLRGNLPFGTVTTATYTSSNGCKIAYFNEWDCCDDVGVNKSDIKPWMEDVLRKWHKVDPVDELEVTRNDVIYTEFQHNRNPFIDYPEWIEVMARSAADSPNEGGRHLRCSDQPIIAQPRITQRCNSL
eukprot:gene33356-41160_t